MLKNLVHLGMARRGLFVIAFWSWSETNYVTLVMTRDKRQTVAWKTIFCWHGSREHVWRQNNMDSNIVETEWFQVYVWMVSGDQNKKCCFQNWDKNPSAHSSYEANLSAPEIHSRLRPTVKFPSWVFLSLQFKFVSVWPLTKNLFWLALKFELTQSQCNSMQIGSQMKH